MFRLKSKVIEDAALCFDDVLIAPQFFNKKSRSEVDISTSIAGVDLKIPIIAANMPSVCESEMAAAMARCGGLGIIHRMCSIEDQQTMVRKAAQEAPRGSAIGAAIGIGQDWLERSKALIGAGASIICIDVAHFAQQSALDVLDEFKKVYPQFPLIAGNLATNLPQMHSRKYENIAYKIGVGGGSMCTTRIMTGCGLPTLQSLLNYRCGCGQDYQPPNMHNLKSGDVLLLSKAEDYLESVSSDEIIADGGIKTPGDVAKSLTLANAVMLGSMLAGTDQAPGDVIKGNDGQKYKVYRGAASYAEKKKYFNKAEYVEGEEMLVSYKGDVEKVVAKICDGLRSAMSYSGNDNLEDFRKYSKLVTISDHSHSENGPHGLSRR